MRNRACVRVLIAGILASHGTANARDCSTLFAEGRRPEITNVKLDQRLVPLCYDAFAVLHSGVARTPLYAAERLTREGVSAARGIDRIDAFHDEDALPPDDRALLEDYVRSGFDRGHMAPAGDMPTEAAQAQSFSLANVVPQDRAVNRGLWAAIEESVRRLSTRRGTLFVVTGPVYSGGSVRAINGRVLVPTQLFKALYDPATGEAGAYLVPNADDASWRAVSLDFLRQETGLDVFPTLPAAAKATAMALPEPRAYSRGPAEGDGSQHRRRPDADSFEAWAKRELHRALRRLWRDLMRAIF
ncbi:DNA/RNA non-specific endonuclease [Methylobacterium sp. Leaf117]|uniref:DNA/RNA non-specific endonuclease n=1 Tax=Methylobacterium sp. Leaf117 TaxID=1736260 RepID=UPI0006F5D088|nr:DNA/RNA non-specific endonuclease [Methylobacterium sp. Leaf117]KQP88870.1 endonuclease [Methylobacterium sp. Leaf117]